MQTITIGGSRKHWSVLTIGGLCFAAAGIFMLLSGGPPLVAWAAIVFFGGGSVVSIRQTLDGRPRIVIDDRGIHDRTLGVGVVEWDDITGVSVGIIQGNAFICLGLADPGKYLGRLSPVARRLAELNRGLGFSEISLNLAGTDADPDRIEELIAKEVAVRRGFPAA